MKITNDTSAASAGDSARKLGSDLTTRVKSGELEKVTVAKNDSLWKLWEKGGKQGSFETFQAQVEKLNGPVGKLFPGDELALPKQKAAAPAKQPMTKAMMERATSDFTPSAAKDPLAGKLLASQPKQSDSLLDMSPRKALEKSRAVTTDAMEATANFVGSVVDGGKQAFANAKMKTADAMESIANTRDNVEAGSKKLQSDLISAGSNAIDRSVEQKDRALAGARLVTTNAIEGSVNYGKRVVDGGRQLSSDIADGASRGWVDLAKKASDLKAGALAGLSATGKALSDTGSAILDTSPREVMNAGKRALDSAGKKADELVRSSHASLAEADAATARGKAKVGAAISEKAKAASYAVEPITNAVVDLPKNVSAAARKAAKVATDVAKSAARSVDYGTEPVRDAVVNLPNTLAAAGGAAVGAAKTAAENADLLLDVTPRRVVEANVEVAKKVLKK